MNLSETKNYPLIQSQMFIDRPKCQSVFVTLTKDMAAEVMLSCLEIRAILLLRKTRVSFIVARLELE